MQTLLRPYKSTKDYARDAVRLQAYGWAIVETTAINAALNIPMAVLAPLTVFSRNSTILVRYSRESTYEDTHMGHAQEDMRRSLALRDARRQATIARHVGYERIGPKWLGLWKRR